mmetsp:Transcript_4088/g.9546  ORF Transcript_4088/g.9546 Transcript_4088/m.9546 type:complete len:261 (-) Transcript_4088:506-1288(-)
MGLDQGDHRLRPLDPSHLSCAPLHGAVLARNAAMDTATQLESGLPEGGLLCGIAGRGDKEQRRDVLWIGREELLCGILVHSHDRRRASGRYPPIQRVSVLQVPIILSETLIMWVKHDHRRNRELWVFLLNFLIVVAALDLDPLTPARRLVRPLHGKHFSFDADCESIRPFRTLRIPWGILALKICSWELHLFRVGGALSNSDSLAEQASVLAKVFGDLGRDRITTSLSKNHIFVVPRGLHKDRAVVAIGKEANDGELVVM